MDDITKLFQRVANDSLLATKPMDIVFGKVESVEPIEIRVDQKLVLKKEQLFLTRNVIDYELEMSVDHVTEDTSGGSGQGAFDSHDHKYKGRKIFLVHNALESGDRVIMLRNQGGQMYIVLDKVVSA